MNKEHQTIYEKASAPETRKLPQGLTPEPFPSILESAEQARRQERMGEGQ
jgi:hypothetical protein